MAKYRLSNVAKEDLIRIHQYGVQKFGLAQADKYFDTLFEYFEIISQRPFSFESVDYLRKGYRRCVCGSESIFESAPKTPLLLQIAAKSNIFVIRKNLSST